MLRVVLPLVVIAALLFLPVFSDDVKGSDLSNESGAVNLTGMDYVGNTVGCWIGQNFSIEGKCEPKGGTKGLAIFAAVFVSAVAAGLGVIGLLPVIGRLTSVVTSLAGVLVVAAIAYYVFLQMGSDEGLEGVQIGPYVGGGAGLLTLISGLAGMKGR
ncbi:MAG: hypothetical protein AAGH38_03760 [Pseudomonadota bacterium]